MCSTAGLPACLCLVVNVNTELPGSLGKKGGTTGYTIHMSCMHVVIKPELLLGEGSNGVIAPRCALEYVCEWESVVWSALCCGHSLYSGGVIPERERGFWTIAHIRGNACIEFQKILGTLSSADKHSGSLGFGP